ncbi:MAG: hypothetical protein ACKVWV_00105 [Planctomycetota bacterium]
MTRRTSAFLITLALATGAPALAGRTAPLASSEAAALRGRESPSLRTLRAGRVDVPPLHSGEKASLRRAQECKPDLAALRAGDGDGIGIVAVVLIVVLLVVLL